MHRVERLAGRAGSQLRLFQRENPILAGRESGIGSRSSPCLGCARLIPSLLW